MSRDIVDTARDVLAMQALVAVNVTDRRRGGIIYIDPKAKEPATRVFCARSICSFHTGTTDTAKNRPVDNRIRDGVSL